MKFPTVDTRRAARAIGRLPCIVQFAAPTAERHLEFLERIERILSRGRFTTTYKFALLLALTNIAVEQGTDGNDPLEVDLDDVARQFLALYWNMARPYPRVHEILKQSTNERKPSTMISLLESASSNAASSYRRLRIFTQRRDALVIQARRTLAKDVLYRLQSVAGNAKSATEDERFLYGHPPDAAGCAKLRAITLKPGIAACMRRLRGVIVAMVQARWALWIREHNAQLAADHKLESFLFGAERTDVSEYAARYYELQNGRCFYTRDRLAAPSAGDVDHFIPWARYPFDSPFNLVLASRKVNNQFRDRLKSREDRALWAQRNEDSFAILTSTARSGFAAAPEDRETVRMIANWVYRAG